MRCNTANAKYHSTINPPLLWRNAFCGTIWRECFRHIATVNHRLLRWNALCGTPMHDGLPFALPVLHCEPISSEPGLVGFHRHSASLQPGAHLARLCAHHATVSRFHASAVL